MGYFVCFEWSLIDLSGTSNELPATFSSSKLPETVIFCQHGLKHSTHSLPHYWRGSLWASGLFRKTAYRNRNKRFSVGIQSMLNLINSVQDYAFVFEEAFPSLFLFLIGCSLVVVAVAKQFLTCIYIIFQWQFFYWKICKLQLQILLHGIRILWFEVGYLNFSIHSLLLLGICDSKDRNPVLSKLLDLQWYFPFLPGLCSCGSVGIKLEPIFATVRPSSLCSIYKPLFANNFLYISWYLKCSLHHRFELLLFQNFSATNTTWTKVQECVLIPTRMKGFLDSSTNLSIVIFSLVFNFSQICHLQLVSQYSGLRLRVSLVSMWSGTGSSPPYGVKTCCLWFWTNRYVCIHGWAPRDGDDGGGYI